MNPTRLFLVAAPLAIGMILGSVAAGASVCERWDGRPSPSAHAGTLTVEENDGRVRLAFDLSAIPKGAGVHHAWLSIHAGGGQPAEPIKVYAIGAITDGAIEHDAKPLVLQAPRYRRFVATDTVRRWVNEPQGNLGFVVITFDGFRPGDSYLEVCYDGRTDGLPTQARGLRAVHHHGQTFLAWTEHPAYRPADGEVIWVEKFSERGDVLAAGPGAGAYGMPRHPAITLRTLRRLQGLGLRDTPSGFQGIKPLKRVADVLPVSYRVYRHDRSITAANVHQAELLGEVDPLSGYDTEVYKIHFKGEYIDQREEPQSVIPTHCVAKGRALKPGEGLYVHTPAKSARAYYAVTTVLAGTENLAGITAANSLAEPVDEKAGRVQPVLQWVQHDNYKDDPTEYWYRYWAAPPLANLPGRSFRVGLAVSDSYSGPGPLTIGSISGAFNVRESIRVPRPDRVTFLMERQLAWLPALFYNEGKGTLRAATECKVDYFSERYMESLIKWIMQKYSIDRSRIEGSLLYFGLRHPEIFPKMSFGAYTATYDYRWAPGSPAHLGPEGIKTVDGEDAWEMYSVGGYVLKYPGRDIPFLICTSGTGKDRGHTSEFGWQDDPRGWRALLDARQPFVASWSRGLPRELSRALGELNWDTSIPAFSNCSLDNNPGNGDPAGGDYYGQINGYLLWSDADVVDEPDRWEMTVFVTGDCPRDGCTVDVTPRHCRRFKPRPGERFNWTVATPDDQRQIGAGQVTADQWGLVTIKNLPVSKRRQRIRISK